MTEPINKSGELKGYLEQLDQTLRTMLGTADSSVRDVAAALGKQAKAQEGSNENLWSIAVRIKDDQLSRFDELKSDIIRTADEIEEEYTAFVEQKEQSILSEVSRLYVAESDYGQYTSATATTLGQLADGISLNANLTEQVQTELAAMRRENEAFIEVTPDAIINRVDEYFMSKDEAESLENRVTSSITQTASDIIEQFTNKLGTTKESVDGVTGQVSEFMLDVNSYIKRGELENGVYGMEIGRSDSNIKTRFLNDRISFYQGGAEVAYISDNNLYILRAEILDYLKLGDSTNGYFTFDVTGNGLEIRYST